MRDWADYWNRIVRSWHVEKIGPELRGDLAFYSDSMRMAYTHELVGNSASDVNTVADAIVAGSGFSTYGSATRSNLDQNGLTAQADEIIRAYDELKEELDAYGKAKGLMIFYDSAASNYWLSLSMLFTLDDAEDDLFNSVLDGFKNSRRNLRHSRRDLEESFPNRAATDCGKIYSGNKAFYRGVLL